jgi:hypothetical protein
MDIGPVRMIYINLVTATANRGLPPLMFTSWYDAYMTREAVSCMYGSEIVLWLLITRSISIF